MFQIHVDTCPSRFGITSPKRQFVMCLYICQHDLWCLKHLCILFKCYSYPGRWKYLFSDSVLRCVCLWMCHLALKNCVFIHYFTADVFSWQPTCTS